MKKYILLSILFGMLFSCSNDEADPVTEDTSQEEMNETENPKEENPAEENKDGYFTDNFDTDGPLENYVTNNASALPEVVSASGRYKAILTDNTGNVTLHFNNSQGRIDTKPVEFPFEFIARNIGICTTDDSQTAPESNNDPYVFCGVQVHVKDFNSINSSHVAVGHRGGTGYTIEDKNTVDGASSVNDIGENTVERILELSETKTIP